MSPGSQNGRARVSVIIPCYNQAVYLREAIESAFEQHGACIEVIVVDDGSDEDVASVVASYSNAHYIRQRNSGVSAARNRGFDASSGRYLVFLDSDDRLTTNAVRDQLHELDGDADALAAVGLSRIIGADGRPLPFDQEPPVRGDTYCNLLQKNFIWMPAQVLYRREAFAETGGFDSSVNACADYDLYLRLARTGPLVCHRSVVAEYRFHGDSMSRNPALMLRATMKVLARQPAWIERSPSHRSARQRGRAFWRGYYGDALVEKVRRQLRFPGRRLELLSDVMTLARYYSPAIFRNLRGKLRTVLQR